MSIVTIGIAQINSCVGDLVGNAKKIESSVHDAYKKGANIVITPELALIGYPPEDLLLQKSFLMKQKRQLDMLQSSFSSLQGLHVIIGHTYLNQTNKLLYNAASIFLEGKSLGVYCKRNLPNYSVFDEKRYFNKGIQPLIFKVKNITFSIAICEDIWFDQTIYKAETDVMLVLNASPYNILKEKRRYEIVEKIVKNKNCTVAYVNMVGGQDELVFDGNSFVMNNLGKYIAMPSFCEATYLINIGKSGVIYPSIHNSNFIQPPDTVESKIWKALKLSLQDYLKKNSFSNVMIGLSGGIDSALVLAIAHAALGSDKIKTIMMPSPYTSDISKIDAFCMSKHLGVHHIEISIETMIKHFETMIFPFVKKNSNEKNITKENIQSRIRGLILMTLSNDTGNLVLATGNKSEIATGYCTLYGDTIGGFATIKDLTKTLVYRLAKWSNRCFENIPSRIIKRLPSAELYHGQTDQDTLPSYDILDGIIERYMGNNESANQIISAGYPHDIVMRVLNLIHINEYKRRQYPIGPKITSCAFGKDWRFPITNRFK
ncbi:MAG: NAD+ synthase [Bordetella sp.]|nr:MAG: NAD+ synthase [Bordetella sp.]